MGEYIPKICKKAISRVPYIPNLIIDQHETWRDKVDCLRFHAKFRIYWRNMSPCEAKTNQKMILWVK